MKARPFFAILCSLVLLVVTFTGVWTWDLWRRSPLDLFTDRRQPTPQSLVFVPRQAPLVLSLLTNPDRLGLFAQLASPLTRRGETAAEWQQVETSVLGATGLDYPTEIAPWLGEEMTLAIANLDRDGDPANGAQPGYLLIVAARDGAQAREFVQRKYSGQLLTPRQRLARETFGGVPLLFRQQGNEVMANAIVGPYVLFANDVALLKNALNNLQAPGQSLAQTPAYRQAFGDMTGAKVALVWAQLPDLAAWLGNLPQPEAVDLRQAVAMQWELHPQGLRSQVALFLGDGVQAKFPPVDRQTWQTLPKDTVLAIAGRDLVTLGEKLPQLFPPTSPLGQLLNQAWQRFQEPLGVDLKTAIAPAGDYALGWVKEGDRLPWIAALDGDDHLGETLDRLAQEQQLSVSPVTLGNTQATAWTQLRGDLNETGEALAAQVRGVRVAIGGQTLIANALHPIRQSLQGQRLGKQNRFQQAMNLLPPQGEAYVYLDWQQGRSYWEKTFPILRVVEFVAKPFFNHWDYGAIASEGQDDQGVYRADLFLHFR